MKEQTEMTIGGFSKNTRDVTIKNLSDHTEIIIMENDWKRIYKTVHKISIQKNHLSISDMIVGAAFPYFLELCKDPQNYEAFMWQLIICLFLLIVVHYVCLYIPNRNDEKANQVLLEELKECIDDVDSKNNINEAAKKRD